MCARARATDEFRVYVMKVGPQFRPDLHNFGRGDPRATDVARGGRPASSTMPSRWDRYFGWKGQTVLPSQMAARGFLFSTETPIDDGAVQHGRPFVRPRDRIPLPPTSTRHEFPRSFTLSYRRFISLGETRSYRADLLRSLDTSTKMLATATLREFNGCVR